MGVIGMSRLFTDFLSREWNLYGLQILAGSLIVIVLHQYLTIFQIIIMGVCIYLIAICQRILGIRYGMIICQLQKDRVAEIVDRVKKIRKQGKNKGKKDV